MRFAVCLCVVFTLTYACAGRVRGGGNKFGGGSRGGGNKFGGGSRRGGGSSSTKWTPAPPPKTHTSSSGTSYHPSAPQPPRPPTVQTNGPIGFERFGNQQGTKPIGFDKVNSPSAPPYPGTNSGPPPPYPGTHAGSFGSAADHPPAYPGRPVNAPPSYSPNNHYPSHQYPVNNYPGQHSYSGQQSFGNAFSNSYPQQNQFGGTHPVGGSSYPSNIGFFPGQTGAFGSHYPHSTPYQGNTFGGSPFGNAGQSSNPYYNPQNFGYSSNPGYFGGYPHGGYSGYPGQYDNYQKKSRFGGLPIPIPIPIPIPFGGGGFGGLGGYGGYSGLGGSGYSYQHRLLDTFIKKQTQAPGGNSSSTAVFILNNSTVTPCTSDHFMYDNLLKVSVVSCTAEFCTAIKLYATTNISNVVTVHSAGVTLCLENNATYSYYGDNISPTFSGLQQENFTVCRDVSVMSNSTEANETTTLPSTDVTTTTTTMEPPSNTTINQTVCEPVNCSRVEMCFPSIEIVDKCPMTDNCPFNRMGFKPCVTIKMCRSPSAPVSTFATLNTTISKIDEYNNYNSRYDAANLTLISYHRPVISFNCTSANAPGCPVGPANVTQST